MGGGTSKGDFGWSEDDLDKYMADDAGGLFLQSYSLKEAEALFDEFLWPSQRLQRHFDREGFLFHFDLKDPFVHCLMIGHRKLGPISPNDPRSFLVKVCLGSAKRMGVLCSPIADVRTTAHF